MLHGMPDSVKAGHRGKTQRRRSRDDDRPAIEAAPHLAPFYDKGKGKAHTEQEDHGGGADDDGEEAEQDVCLICLRTDIQDRSILPTCLHSLFCFDCILEWTKVKRSCPLCNRPIGDYILHNVRSDSDYSRHFLRPSGDDDAIAVVAEGSIGAERRRAGADLIRQRVRGRYLPVVPRYGERSGWTEWTRSGSEGGEEASEAALAEQERAIERRRLVYRHGLYAKHVGSNRHTGFRPPPTAQDFATQPHHLTRLAPFLRRELYSLPLPPGSLDVEFLMTYIASILKTMDIRSEGAVRLLAEFFGSRALAEHFSHEIMTFCRSNARDCRAFDRRVEYDWPWMGDAVRRAEEKEPAARTSTQSTPRDPSPQPLLARLGPPTTQADLLSRMNGFADADPP